MSGHGSTGGLLTVFQDPKVNVFVKEDVPSDRTAHARLWTRKTPSGVAGGISVGKEPNCTAELISRGHLECTVVEME